MKRSKKTCPKCRKRLTAHYCWPGSDTGWGYLYCENGNCGVLKTKIMGEA